MAYNAAEEAASEAYARQLQAQEAGFAYIDQRTPLMLNNNQIGQQPNVINARINDLTSERASVIAILVVNLPQVLAAIIVLSMHWNDEDVCDEAHRQRWRWWAALAAARLLAYSVVVTGMYVFKRALEQNQTALVRVTNIRNIIDALGLIWFVVGNMWLYGLDETGCKHPERSPVYTLCVAMLIVNYVQICLPCILAVILIPIFCFCMPCLIRFLARLQGPEGQYTAGATDEEIDNLQLVTIRGSDDPEKEPDVCPICLGQFLDGEEARVLRCSHTFHRACVEEWLRVNASCPTCRQSIFHRPDSHHADPEAGEHASEPTETQRLVPPPVGRR